MTMRRVDPARIHCTQSLYAITQSHDTNSPIGSDANPGRWNPRRRAATTSPRIHSDSMSGSSGELHVIRDWSNTERGHFKKGRRQVITTVHHVVRPDELVHARAVAPRRAHAARAFNHRDQRVARRYPRGHCGPRMPDLDGRRARRSHRRSRQTCCSAPARGNGRVERLAKRPVCGRKLAWARRRYWT